MMEQKTMPLDYSINVKNEPGAVHQSQHHQYQADASLVSATVTVPTSAVQVPSSHIPLSTAKSGHQQTSANSSPAVGGPPLISSAFRVVTPKTKTDGNSSKLVLCLSIPHSHKCAARRLVGKTSN